MSDVNGAAPAAAESAPVAETPVVDTPNPISTEPEGQPEPEKVETKPVKTEKTDAKPPTAREALQKAAAKVEKDNAPVKAEKADKDDKAPAKSEPVRDETGKFAAKDDKPADVKAAKDAPAEKNAEPPKPSFTAGEAPARFSQDAKAKWAETHESVRAETERAIRELTQGHEKYKTAAERDAGLNEFHDMAKQSGKELRQVVSEYVNMENHLRKDLVGGLDTICSRMGVSLKDVAAHVLGQTPDQNASAQDATIRDLKNTIAKLEQKVGTVSQTVQQQRESATLQEVTKFAADHPRFEELSEDIAFFMKSGRAKDLSEAYTLAERLNPGSAPAVAPAAASSAAPDLSVQTEKGQKSIAGSPSPGSDPVRRAPSTSIKESLRRAMAQAS